MLPRAIPSDSAEPVSRALQALQWATHVATEDAGALAQPPERPSAEEWRCLTLQSFRAEVDALLLGRHTQEGLDALLAIGALEVWLPEVYALVGFGDGEWRHKDVWKHTKQVVWQSVPRLQVRWGALLHDIGKVKTRRIEPSGEVHFFGHSEVGAAMFRKRVGQRLGFEPELYDQIHFLILHHLRASQYDGDWTDSAVRRFAREMEQNLTDLLDLSRADITTKRPERKKRGLRQISDLAQRIEKLRAEDAKVPPLPKGIGSEIMRRFELPASRLIGDLRDQLEREVEAGALEPRREAEYYVAWLEANRARLGF
ncbi:MAG: HDIG domain-containing metalloprotein [Polyangiales bacterium]